MASINIVELDKSFLTLFLVLATMHSFGDLLGGAGTPSPSVRSWPRPPSVRGLIRDTVFELYVNSENVIRQNIFGSSGIRQMTLNKCRITIYSALSGEVTR